MEGFHKKSAKGFNQKKRSLKRTVSNPDPKKLLVVVPSNTANFYSATSSLLTEEAPRRIGKKTKTSKSRRLSLGIYASQSMKNTQNSAKTKIAQIVEEIQLLEHDNLRLKESIKNAQTIEQLLVEAYKENSLLKQQIGSNHSLTIEQAMQDFQGALKNYIHKK